MRLCGGGEGGWVDEESTERVKDCCPVEWPHMVAFFGGVLWGFLALMTLIDRPSTNSQHNCPMGDGVDGLAPIRIENV